MTGPLGFLPQYPQWQPGSSGQRSEPGKPSSDSRTASSFFSTTTPAPSSSLTAFSGANGSQASDAISQAKVPQSGNVDQPIPSETARTPVEKAEQVKKLVVAEKAKAQAKAVAAPVTDAKPVDAAAENAAKGSALFTALGGADNSRAKGYDREGLGGEFGLSLRQPENMSKIEAWLYD
ncbi:MAG: hypothetical protein WCF85_17115 [Rhodospirillaceae bacterium]